MKKRPTKKSVIIAKKKADMPVSELAGMVARGFTDVEKRLGDKIDSVEERLTGRITILDQKADRLQDSVNELSYESRKKRTRIENLELKVFGTIQEP